MSVQNLSVLNTKPPIDDFISLRAECGWGRLDIETATRTLAASLANITVFETERVVGFGRVVGDGAIYFYVQDLIVAADYRGQGIGSDILKALIGQTRDIASPGASIGLMSAKGKEPFYEGFGFAARPNCVFGAGMTLLLDDT